MLDRKHLKKISGSLPVLILTGETLGPAIIAAEALLEQLKELNEKEEWKCTQGKT